MSRGITVQGHQDNTLVRPVALETRLMLDYDVDRMVDRVRCDVFANGYPTGFYSVLDLGDPYVLSSVAWPGAIHALPPRVLDRLEEDALRHLFQRPDLHREIADLHREIADLRRTVAGLLEPKPRWYHKAFVFPYRAARIRATAKTTLTTSLLRSTMTAVAVTFVLAGLAIVAESLLR